MVSMAELRAVATKVTVPGAPPSLRLGSWYEAPGAEPRVSWSFNDPFHDDGDVLLGTTVAHGGAGQVWQRAQLDAAWVYKLHVDADWVPGVPAERRQWTVEEAWEALLRYFGRDGRTFVVDENEVRGVDLTLRGVTPESWAAYLNATTGPDLPAREVLPAGEVEDGDLPTWVYDELTFGFGDVGALRLVDGRVRPDPGMPS